MSSVPTPNYVLTEAVSLYANGHGTVELPAGAFVRPIELRYVPKHVIEENERNYFDPQTHVYCYTRYGIRVINKASMRLV